VLTLSDLVYRCLSSYNQETPSKLRASTTVIGGDFELAAYPKYRLENFEPEKLKFFGDTAPRCTTGNPRLLGNCCGLLSGFRLSG
jgi:hypothetical protein